MKQTAAATRTSVWADEKKTTWVSLNEKWNSSEGEISYANSEILAFKAERMKNKKEKKSKTKKKKKSTNFYSYMTSMRKRWTRSIARSAALIDTTYHWPIFITKNQSIAFVTCPTHNLRHASYPISIQFIASRRCSSTHFTHAKKKHSKCGSARDKCAKWIFHAIQSNIPRWHMRPTHIRNYSIDDPTSTWTNPPLSEWIKRFLLMYVFGWHVLPNNQRAFQNKVNINSVLWLISEFVCIMFGNCITNIFPLRNGSIRLNGKVLTLSRRTEKSTDSFYM